MTAQHVIHLGDCIDGMRTLDNNSVDVTLCDPPYSEHVENGQAVSGRRSGQAVIRKSKIGVGFLTDAQIKNAVGEIVRVTRRWIVAFCAFEQVEQYKRALEAAGGRYVRCCAWEKPDGTPQLSGDRPATWGECFVVGYASTDGAMQWNGGGKRGLYRCGVQRGATRAKCWDDDGEKLVSAHPTQKPLSLMLELVTDFTEPGELVFDPFAGSGTTGVACRQLGRRFVGWELDAKYHAIAVRRIAGDEASPRPEQPSLFGIGGLV